MYKLINLMQSVTEEYRALAWLILGVLLAVLVVIGLVTLYWISHGGLSCQRISEKQEAEELSGLNDEQKPA
jgi:ABC-type uncharacterized transport system permease subunit